MAEHIKTEVGPVQITEDGVVYRAVVTTGRMKILNPESFVVLRWDDGSVTTAQGALMKIGMWPLPTP